MEVDNQCANERQPMEYYYTCFKALINLHIFDLEFVGKYKGEDGNNICLCPFQEQFKKYWKLYPELDFMKNNKPCSCNRPMSPIYFWSHLKSYGVVDDPNHIMVCCYLKNLYGDVDGCEYLNSEQETKKKVRQRYSCVKCYILR